MAVVALFLGALVLGTGTVLAHTEPKGLYASQVTTVISVKGASTLTNEDDPYNADIDLEYDVSHGPHDPLGNGVVRVRLVDDYNYAANGGTVVGIYVEIYRHTHCRNADFEKVVAFQVFDNDAWATWKDDDLGRGSVKWEPVNGALGRGPRQEDVVGTDGKARVLFDLRHEEAPDDPACCLLNEIDAIDDLGLCIDCELPRIPDLFSGTCVCPSDFLETEDGLCEFPTCNPPQVWNPVARECICPPGTILDPATGACKLPPFNEEIVFPGDTGSATAACPSSRDDINACDPLQSYACARVLVVPMTCFSAQVVDETSDDAQESANDAAGQADATLAPLVQTIEGMRPSDVAGLSGAFECMAFMPQFPSPGGWGQCSGMGGFAGAGTDWNGRPYHFAAPAGVPVGMAFSHGDVCVEGPSVVGVASGVLTTGTFPAVHDGRKSMASLAVQFDWVRVGTMLVVTSSWATIQFHDALGGGAQSTLQSAFHWEMLPVLGPSNLCSTGGPAATVIGGNIAFAG